MVSPKLTPAVAVGLQRILSSQPPKARASHAPKKKGSKAQPHALLAFTNLPVS
jgi:hypothetical protein